MSGWAAFMAGAALAGLAAAVVATVSSRAWRRRLAARVAAAAGALDPDAPTRAPERLEGALEALESAVDRALRHDGELELTETRLELALSAVPQGVVIFDADGAVVFRNDPAAVYLAARHGEALVEAAIVQLSREAVVGQAGSRNVELFGPPRRSLVLRAFPLGAPAAVGALVVIEDVSERRRLEAVRRDFVANISHELKTPVGALGLLAETLLDEEDPAVCLRLAERMLNEAFRVGRTIDDLLELSRIEAEQEASREPVAIHLCIAEAVSRVRPGAEAREVEIEVDEPSHRLNVLGDRRQLVSAIYNLLENAVKYSDAHSTVELRTRTNGEWVDISVEDHGIGIPRRDLERIFERFYRVDRARSRDTGGTGLGLSIVRHVASNHHGEVRVESQEGEGSTFTLRLPAGPGPVIVAAEAG